MSDETEETEIITNQPLDPIVAAKISADPSMPNVEKAATQEPIYLDAQKLLAEPLNQPVAEPILSPQPSANTKPNIAEPILSPQSSANKKPNIADDAGQTGDAGHHPAIRTLADDGNEMAIEDETAADISLLANTFQKRRDSEQNPTAQLSEGPLDPRDEPATAEADQTVDAPIATPHILEPTTPTKLPSHASIPSTGVEAIAPTSRVQPTAPPALTEIDHDPAVQEPVTSPASRVMEKTDTAHPRPIPEQEFDASTKPVTPKLDRPQSTGNSGEHLSRTNANANANSNASANTNANSNASANTNANSNASANTNTNASSNTHTDASISSNTNTNTNANTNTDTGTNPANQPGQRSIQSPSLQQPRPAPSTRSGAKAETSAEQEPTETTLLPKELIPKEPKNDERQVFSLKIDPEIQSKSGPARSEPKSPKEVPLKTEPHHTSVTPARSEPESPKEVPLKTEPHHTSVTPPRIDSQSQGAILTPTTVEAIAERNTSLNTTSHGSQPGGERLPTLAAAMVLNTRDVQWGQRLVAQIERISSNGEGKLELSLRPKNLGDMHITLDFKGDETQVRIVTETNVASRVLIGAEDRLAQMLDAAGFKLSTFSASSDGGLGQGLGQHSRQKQQATPGGSKNRDTETGVKSERSGESHNGTVNVIA
jgi:flagellar hook-length control protein FliK